MTSLDNDDRETRLRFLGIDEELGAILRDVWKEIDPKLPDILDGFYRHVTAVPQLAKMIGNDIPRLKKAQGSHWSRLFAGRFDDAYMAGVRTIGLTHNRIGLDTGACYGGALSCGVLTNNLDRIIRVTAEET